MNPIEIAKAWLKSVNHTDEEKALAQERYEVCKVCPLLKELMGIETCTKCFCPVSIKGTPLAKVYSDEINPCPLKKWVK